MGERETGHRLGERETDHRLEKEDGGELPQPALPEQYTDLRLQTRYESAVLQKRLRQTYHVAHAYIEEQGVNILYLALGMLQWREPNTADVVRRAPLLLIPVEIARTNAHNRYHIRYNETEIGTNLSLEAKLRIDFGLALPVVSSGKGFDVAAYFAEVGEAVQRQDDWAVDETAVALGFFSFNKFLMYQDLDPDHWPEDRKPSQHGVMRALLTPRGFREQTAVVPEGAFIDESVDLAESHVVVEADSSQLRAILAVNDGRHLVIQGPPGTGKSQTITNLIAEAVGQGKTVLFVSEKMAALEVVKRKLDQVGLGDAALPLHSHTATKRAFAKEMKRTMGLGEPQKEGVFPELEQLQWTIEQLNRYSQRVNEPLKGSDLTRFELCGRLIEREERLAATGEWRTAVAAWLPDLLAEDGERVVWPRVTSPQYEACLALIQEGQQLVGRIGRPADHPFAATAAREAVPTEQIQSWMERWQQGVKTHRQLVTEMAQLLGRAVPETWEDGVALSRLGQLVAAAPNLSEVEVASAVWHEQKEEIGRTLELGMTLGRLYQLYETRLVPEAWEQDVTALREAFDGVAERRWPWLSADYRRACHALAGLCQQKLPESYPERLAMIEAIYTYQRLQLTYQPLEPLLSRLFGLRYNRWKSMWTEMGVVATWLDHLHGGAADGRPIDPALFDVITALTPDQRERLTPLCDQVLQVERDIDVVRQTVKDRLKLDPLQDGIGYEGLSEQLGRYFTAAPRFGEMVAYHLLCDRFVAMGGHRWPAVLFHWEHAATHLSDLFVYLNERGLLFAPQWTDVDPLPEMSGERHGELSGRFAQLDRSFLEHNRYKLAYKHWSRLPRYQAGGLVGMLQRESRKRAGHQPIRQMMTDVGPLIQQIKPIFMMSPLSIAMFLPPGEVWFDLVVFDEASQVRPVDAFGALVRGRQAVIVGDSRQLPPTTFFDRVIGDGRREGDGDEGVGSTGGWLGRETGHSRGREGDGDEGVGSTGGWLGRETGHSGGGGADGDVGSTGGWLGRETGHRYEGAEEEGDESDLIGSNESVLDLFVARGAPQQMLSWHYRSQHESLIALSNQQFYDGQLVIFPSPDATRSEVGVHLRHQPTTVYDRGKSRVNRQEARSVAEAVLAHAEKSPQLTLGVVTFSSAQREAIVLELEQLRRKGAAAEPFFQAHPHEPFFVKNLENVQGDERDVMLLSIGYGRGADGKVRLNFGPLNSEGGERRLNVLITRARRRCEIFTNLTAEDIDLRRTESKGVAALKAYLAYAASGQLSQFAPEMERPISPLERFVAGKLIDEGYRVTHRVGLGGVEVDLAIKHPDRSENGRYLVGIEFDGADYYRAKSARDRDRTQIEVLSRLTHRVGLGGVEVDLAIEHPDRSENGRYLVGIEFDGADYYRAKSARDRDRTQIEVLSRLTHRVGLGGVEVDLAIEHPDRSENGRYLVGIEFDGADYYRAKSARDRDRTQIEVLSRLGWQIVRVWSGEWLRDTAGALAGLLTAVRQLVEGDTSHEKVSLERGSAIPPLLRHPKVRLGVRKVEPYQKHPLVVPAVGVQDRRGWSRRPKFSKEYYKVLKSLLCELIEHEGPIHYALAAEHLRARAVRSGYSIPTRERVSIFKDGADEGLWVFRNHFLYSAKMIAEKSYPLRDWRGIRKHYLRPDYISNEEIGLGVRLLVQDALEIPPLELLKPTLRLLGFTTTINRFYQEHIIRVLLGLLREGALVYDSGTDRVRLVREGEVVGRVEPAVWVALEARLKTLKKRSKSTGGQEKGVTAERLKLPKYQVTDFTQLERGSRSFFKRSDFWLYSRASGFDTYLSLDGTVQTVPQADQFWSSLWGYDPQHDAYTTERLPQSISAYLKSSERVRLDVSFAGASARLFGMLSYDFRHGRFFASPHHYLFYASGKVVPVRRDVKEGVFFRGVKNKLTLHGGIEQLDLGTWSWHKVARYVNPDGPELRWGREIALSKGFEDVARAQEVRWLRAILQQESPIHEAMLGQRVAKLAGQGHVTARLGDFMAQWLDYAAARGIVERRAPFIWSLEHPAVCLHDWQVMPKEASKLAYVSPEGLAELLLLFVKHEQGVVERGLAKTIATFLGVQRPGKVEQARVVFCLAWLVESGYLVRNRSGRLALGATWPDWLQEKGLSAAWEAALAKDKDREVVVSASERERAVVELSYQWPPYQRELFPVRPIPKTATWDKMIKWERCDEWIVYLTAREGPLHVEVLKQQLQSLVGKGSTKKALFHGAAQKLHDQKRLIFRESFLYAPDDALPVPRYRHYFSGPSRTMAWVAKEEVAQGVRVILTAGIEQITKDEMLSLIPQFFFGGRMIGANLKWGEGVLMGMIEAGEVWYEAETMVLQIDQTKATALLEQAVAAAESRALLEPPRREDEG